MSRSRAWCFTYHLGHEDHYEALLERVECKYIVYGREVCPTTGRQHLQGYVEFVNAKTMSAVKTAMSCDSLHLEKRKGTAKEASDYCKKDGNFEERGEISKDPKEGGSMEKDRWARSRELAQEGRFDEIDDELWIKYQSSFKKMRTDAISNVTTRLEKMDNEWWWSRGTGKGKSKLADKLYGDAYWYKKTKNGWWDHYNGEDVVVIEEMNKYHPQMGEDLKEWMGHRPFRVEVKGSMINIRPKKFVILSNYPPEGIWNEYEILAPLKRRLKVFEFTRTISDDPNDYPQFGTSDIVPYDVPLPDLYASNFRP